MQEHTPPFIRGLGTVCILGASIVAAAITATVKPMIEHRPISQMRFSVDKPFATLTEDEKKLRPYHIFLNETADRVDEVYQDTKKKDFLTRVTTDPILGSLTYLGTALVAFSFFAESSVKRKKAQEANKAPEPTCPSVTSPAVAGAAPAGHVAHL